MGCKPTLPLPEHLGYAAAAEWIPAFLGPLFVRSKVDDVSAVNGT